MNKLQYDDFMRLDLQEQYWLSNKITIERLNNCIKVYREYGKRKGIEITVFLNDFSFKNVKKAIQVGKREISVEYSYVKPLSHNCVSYATSIRL